MEGLQEDGGDGSMLCAEHPFKNNTPAGGICAFCLQEKLGKLVSSSFPIAVFPSSSSSSPSFRSDTTTIASTVIPPPPLFTNTTSSMGSNTTNNCHYNHHHHSNRSRILYLLKKKKKKDSNITVNINSGAGGQNDRNKNLVFKRSKSTAAARHYDNVLDTPNKRGFWSFLHLQQKHSQSSSSNIKTLRGISSNSMRASQQDRDIIMENESNESPRTTSFDRKVSRSRSVGCGSRSFSGDFFERISTGFGDCTLRRVESQREGKVKVNMNAMNGGRDCIQERVRCGGLFSGFGITSSSSSSSSSSNWVGSNASNANEVSGGNVAGKVTSAVAGVGHRQQHSRSRSWGWALASPMRAFSKPSSSSARSQKKNANPNLAAMPSLLSVSS